MTKAKQGDKVRVHFVGSLPDGTLFDTSRERPPKIQMKEGRQLEARNPDGRTLRFAVAACDDQTVTPDGNHPLAGQGPAFETKAVEILSAA